MKHKLMDLQQLLVHNNELTGTLVTSASIAEEKKQISETAAKLATCREARIINLNETAKLWNKRGFNMYTVSASGKSINIMIAPLQKSDRIEVPQRSHRT
jgi:hypothetical protein